MSRIRDARHRAAGSSAPETQRSVPPDETRAATARYRDLAAGTVIVFVCGDDRFERTAESVRRFPSVAALLATYQVRDIHPDLRTAEELEALYAGFPGYAEKIRANGIIVFELSRPTASV